MQDSPENKVFIAEKGCFLRDPIWVSLALDRTFSVARDASEFGIGSELLQMKVDGRERFITFLYRQLKA